MSTEPHTYEVVDAQPTQASEGHAAITIEDALRTRLHWATEDIMALEAELRAKPPAVPASASSPGDAVLVPREKLMRWMTAAMEGKSHLIEHEIFDYTEAPSASEAPLSAIGAVLNDAMATAAANGANSISMPDHYVEVAAWLAGIQPIATSAGDALQDRVKQTRYIHRFGDALQALCGGHRPPDAMMAAWLDSDDESLQEFVIDRTFAWAQGIGIIDAARVAADSPTEGVDHEHRAPSASEAPTVPEGYTLVLVPDVPAPGEPDWDECKRQAEAATGLEVDPSTFSILKREVRRWIAHRGAAPTTRASEAPIPCDGCNGRGLVGGLLPGDGGYETRECPFCNGSGAAPTTQASEAPVAWLRIERDDATGPATLYPLVILGTRKPEGYRATYEPVYAAPKQAPEITKEQIDTLIQQHVDPVATYRKLHDFARDVLALKGGAAA